MSVASIETSEGEDRLYVESVRNESHEETQAVSSHSTVDLKTVTDNIEETPRTISATFRFTSTPQLSTSRREIRSEQSVQAAQAGGGVVEEPEGGVERLREAVRWFKDHKSEALTYNSPRYGRIPVCAIESYSFSLVRQSHVDIQVELIEILFAESERVIVPPEVVEPTQSKPQVESGEKKKDEEGDESAGFLVSTFGIQGGAGQFTEERETTNKEAQSFYDAIEGAR